MTPIRKITTRNSTALHIRVAGPDGTADFFVRQGCIKNDKHINNADRHWCQLSIQSDFGNAGYFWGHMGCYAHKFFDCDDRDYMLSKLFGKDAYIFDHEKTVETIVRELLHDRRMGDLNYSKARAIYNDIQAWPDFTTADQLYGNWNYPDWCDYPDLPVCKTLNPQALGLWELWPTFVNALLLDHLEKHPPCPHCDGELPYRFGEVGRHTSKCTRPVPF